MPTIKPRITVTLPVHVGDTFRRLAALQKRSAGSVCAELLEASHDPIMRVVAILEAAADAPGQVRAGVRRAAEQAEAEAVGTLGRSLHQLDWILEEVRKGPDGSVGSRPQGRKAKGALAPRRPANPRPSNTGVRSSKQDNGGRK